MKPKEFLITIKVKSELGTKPNIRTLCGDTIYLYLEDGQEAHWSFKQIRKPKKLVKQSRNSIPTNIMKK